MLLLKIGLLRYRNGELYENKIFNYTIYTAVIAAVALKIMSMFAMDGNGLLFGMNKSTINYCVIGISLGLFAVCVLINLFDRRTAPVYPVKRNVVSGALAILSGLAIVGSSFLTLLNTTPATAKTTF